MNLFLRIFVIVSSDNQGSGEARSSFINDNVDFDLILLSNENEIHDLRSSSLIFTIDELIINLRILLFPSYLSLI